MTAKGTDVDELRAQRGGGVTCRTEATEHEIAVAAAEIRELHRRSTMNEAAAIGRIILDTFYAGTPAAWRSHHPEKASSIRRLARELGGVFTNSMLRRCVRVWLVTIEHPRITKCAHLTASHADEVYGLAFDETEKLLERAETEHWNVLALRRAKRQVLMQTARPGVRSPGRPVSPPEFKAITRLSNAAAAVEDALSLLDGVDEPHPEAQERLAGYAKQLRVISKRIIRKLEQRSSSRAFTLNVVPEPEEEAPPSRRAG